MAGAKIRGITIEISGDTTQLQKDLRTVNSVIKDTQKELKDVEKLLKVKPGNTELLKQKYKLLGDQIAYTEHKLKTLKDAQKTMDENGVDQTSEQYMALQREIIETEDKLKSLNKEMKDFGSVGAQKVKALGEQMKKAGQKISAVGSKLTKSVTVPLVALGTASAKLASDYEENLNKIDVAFGASAEAVKEWANNAIDEFGLSKVAATDAVSAFGALGKGIGLAEDDAAEMSITLTGLSADLASYFNTSNDDSAKALEGIFTGETEALKKFGVVMNETNLKQFAEDQGLVWQELDQTQKTMIRYQFVLSKTTDAQGDYSRTSDGTANSVKTFKAALENLGTSIGENVLPVITPLINKVTEILKQFDELSPKTKKAIVTFLLVAVAVGPLLVVLGKLATGIGTILTLAPLLAGGLSPWIFVIGGAITAGILLYKNWDKIKEEAAELAEKLSEAWESVKTWTTETWANVKSTVTSKFNAVKTAISLAIANIRYRISTAWTNIKTWTTDTWEAIKTDVVDKFETAKTTVTDAVELVKTTLTDTWETIKQDTTDRWEEIKSAITKPFDEARSTVEGIINTIKGWFPIDIGNIFKNIKLPHFSITEGESILGISIPKISVAWYRKAMDNAVMLNGASVFGMMGGKLLAGGEAGREVVVSYDKLAQMLGGNRESNTNTTNISVTVNAAPGMDERTLADYVARRIQQKVNQKGAVWA